MDQLPDIFGLTDAVRAASQILTNATTGLKNQTFEAIATAIVERSEEILHANESDLARGHNNQMNGGLLDGLALTPERIEAIANPVREVEALPDPVGEVIRGTRSELGLRITQLRVPMEAIGMIYEAHPDVTIDAAVLALKAGNAMILRGGSATQKSNKAIIGVMHEAFVPLGPPADLVQSVDSFDHAGATAMMKARGGIDVLIPRGGTGFIHTVIENSIVPVIKTGTGNCHMCVDSGANLEAAGKIIMNVKAQRVGVCNTTGTPPVHIDEAEAFCSSALRQLAAAGVTLHLDERAVSTASVSDAIPAKYLKPVVEGNWARKFLSMDLAVRVADSIGEALEHIRRYSGGHTEATCTRSLASASHFRTELDSAAITISASTRFTDGGQMGLGTEIGISTQKLHVRGPMGLSELTTSTWVIEGGGTIRPRMRARLQSLDSRLLPWALKAPRTRPAREPHPRLLSRAREPTTSALSRVRL